MVEYFIRRNIEFITFMIINVKMFVITTILAPSLYKDVRFNPRNKNKR